MYTRFSFKYDKSNTWTSVFRTFNVELLPLIKGRVEKCLPMLEMANISIFSTMSLSPSQRLL